MAFDLDRLRLIVHFGDNSQASYPLELGAYSIGSNKNCTVRLNGPEIADFHAMLTISPTEILLESPEGKRELAPGEEIPLGPYRLCLIELAPPRDVATGDLSPGDRAQVENLWRQHQRGLPGYDNLLEILKSIISTDEARLAQGATAGSLRALRKAIGFLVLLAAAAAFVPPSHPRLSALLYDLAGSWSLVSALVLISRYQVSFAGRLLLPLLWTLRFIEPPAADWYEFSRVIVAFLDVASAALIGAALDFGASTKPYRSYPILRRLALMAAGGITLNDAVTDSRFLARGFLFFYAAAGILCIVWSFWPGPRRERTPRVGSFDAQILTYLGLRRWFRFAAGHALALSLGLIPVLLFLHSFEIGPRLEKGNEERKSPPITTGGEAAQSWYWKHTGDLLRVGDLQDHELYGFLRKNVATTAQAEIERLAEEVDRDPSNAQAYESLQQALSPFRLASPEQALPILSDIEARPRQQKTFPRQQSIYYLEKNSVRDRGPFRAPAEVFSARDQLAFMWPHLDGFTQEEIRARGSNSGFRRFALMICGFIGLLILWRRGADWGYAFWLGLWFLGLGTVGTYRYHLFFFQAISYELWRRSLANPSFNFLLTIFQVWDTLVVVNVFLFLFFVPCAGTWNWVCWPTDRERCLKLFANRPWLGRIAYIVVLGGKTILVASLMNVLFWGSWALLSRILPQASSWDGLASILAAILFVAAVLGVGYLRRTQLHRPWGPLDWRAGYLFLTAQVLALLSMDEVPKLSVRSTAIMINLSYVLICLLIVFFLTLVVRRNFLRLFTPHDAVIVISAALILIALKISEDLMNEGIKFFSHYALVPEIGARILELSVFVLLVRAVHRNIERLVLYLSVSKLNFKSLKDFSPLHLRHIEEQIASVLDLLLNTRDPKNIRQIQNALSACGIKEYAFMTRQEGCTFVSSVSCLKREPPHQIRISDMLLKFLQKHRGALELRQLPFEWKLFFLQFELARLCPDLPAKYLVPVRLGESLRGLLFVMHTSEPRAVAEEPITDSVAEIALLTTQLRYQHFIQP